MAEHDEEVSIGPVTEYAVSWGSWARILGLAIFCSAIGAVWEQQAQLVKGTCHVAESVPPLSAIASLIFLLLLGAVLRAVGLRFGLDRREILCTYAFVCISVTVGAICIYRQVIGYLTTWVYAPQGDSTVAAVRPYLPGWLIPTDPKVVQQLWEGSKGAGVPWGAWLVPLAGLGALFVLFYWTTVCLIGLFHRRWSSDERLRYPVAELATGLVAADSGESGSGLFQNRWFWFGGLLALLFNLCYIIPSLSRDWPLPPVQFDFMDLHLPAPWDAGAPGPYFRLNPVVFGLGFLVSTDVLLTIWVSVLVMKAEAVLAASFGIPSGWAGPLFLMRYQEGLGAYIVLAFLMVWAARRHIWGACQDVVRPRTVAAGAPGRWTIIGLAGGVCLLIVVFVQVGMVLWFAVIFLALMLIRVLVMARVRAQAGIPNIYLHVVEPRSFMWLLGAGTVAAAGEPTVAALILMAFLINCSYLTPYQADGFRIAESTGFGHWRWIVLSTLAVIVGFALASYTNLTAIYRHGFNNLPIGQPLALWPANHILESVKLSVPLDPVRTALIATGAATTALLAILQRAFYWCPFGPVGFVVACAIGDYVGGPVFVVWLLKRTVLKYGGGQAYKAAKAVCVGLVFAHLAIASIWGVLGLFDFAPTLRYRIGFW